MFNRLEKTFILQKTPLFASLSADSLLSIANLCTEVALDAGEELFLTGDIGEAMYIVVRGQVTVERDQEIIATLGAGETVGEMGVLDWEPHSANVLIDQPTLLLRLDRHDLLDLLAALPQLAKNLSHILVSRVRGLSSGSETPVRARPQSSSPKAES